MFDLREHKDLIRRLVSEANQNDPNWKWSVNSIGKEKARIFWEYRGAGAVLRHRAGGHRRWLLDSR